MGWENLTFGRPKLKDKHIVRTILEELKMTQTLKLMDNELGRDPQHIAPEPPIRMRACGFSRNHTQGGSRNGRDRDGGPDYIALDEQESTDFDEEDDESDSLLQHCGCHTADAVDVHINTGFGWKDKLSST